MFPEGDQRVKAIRICRIGFVNQVSEQLPNCNWVRQYGNTGLFFVVTKFDSFCP